mgnify:CR=1 FL=1
MFILDPLLNFLHVPSELVESFFLGIVEITNGIFAISSIPLKKVSIIIIINPQTLNGISGNNLSFSIQNRKNILIYL